MIHKTFVGKLKETMCPIESIDDIERLGGKYFYINNVEKYTASNRYAYVVISVDDGNPIYSNRYKTTDINIIYTIRNIFVKLRKEEGCRVVAFLQKRVVGVSVYHILTHKKQKIAS